MKKFKLFALMLVAGTVMFTSCGKDEEADVPTINVSYATGSDNVAWKADVVMFNVTLGTNEKLENLKIEPNVGNTSNNSLDTTLSGTSFTYVYDYTVPTAGIVDGDQIVITFTVTDDKGGTASTTMTLTMDEPAGANTPFATEYTDGVFYHIAGLLHGAYNLDGHATVGSSGTAADKSMKNTDAAGSTFTGAWTSDAANGTMYVSTSTAYADIYQENVAALYTAGSASATVTPAAGNVYVAKKGTKYYVIEVLTIEPSFSTGTGGNTGRITFKYKM
jgi:hypothetical protein